MGGGGGGEGGGCETGRVTNQDAQHGQTSKSKETSSSFHSKVNTLTDRSERFEKKGGVGGAERVKNQDAQHGQTSNSKVTSSSFPNKANTLMTDRSERAEVTAIKKKGGGRGEQE